VARGDQEQQQQGWRFAALFRTVTTVAVTAGVQSLTCIAMELCCTTRLKRTMA